MIPALRLLSILLLSCVTLAGAAEPKGGPEPYKRLKFRNIGPASGGRICRVAGVPGDPKVYYAATAASGIWKSSDGGFTWTCLTDDLPTSTFGAIAVAPSDPNILYAGSGEANIRGNVEVGNGLYRSTDAGKTWKHVWKQEGQIGTIVVHPRNPDIAYAAVLGKAFGPNPQRGIYRTTDGGVTWKRVLFRNDDTGASDVAIDVSNPRILLAGLWQTRRQPWEMTSGGLGSGLYLSRDGGDTWTQLVAPPPADSPEADKEPQAGIKRAEGLPQGIWGKIGVAIAPSNSRRYYALIEAEKGGLFRSDDGGETWTRINASRSLQQRAWYYSHLTVHPTNADVVYFPQVPLLRTLDGGKTLERVKGPHHGDHHDLWIDPTNPDRMINGNDGGVDITLDGGKSWYAPPLPIAQIYHIDVDNRRPYWVACTIQDIGTARGPSRSLVGSGIPTSDWHPVGGGEAGHIAIDPEDANIVYAGEYGGYISRYDHRTRQARSVSIYPFNASGRGGEELRYRFQWTAPILISPHDRQTVYHAANVLFRTRDGGQTWTAISKDLTRNDRSKQKWSGGPITGDNTGVEIYCTIFALAESRLQKGLLWAGSDDGLLHISPDGGTTWNNVTAGLTRAGLPEWATICCIEPSRFEADTAYVVADAHRLDDRRPYLFVTTDRGQTWRRLTDSMPDIGYLQVIREDPTRKGLLFVGGELGLVFSRNAGGTWEALKLNLPTVRVTDLRVHQDDLVVGTNGRSIWILDDLSALRQPPEQWRDQEVTLFAPLPATRFRTSGQVRPPLPMTSYTNAPAGAVLHYALKTRPKGEVQIEIVDGKNRTIRKLSSKKEEADPPSPGDYSDAEPEKPLPTEPGLHRVVWDLHCQGITRIRNARIDMGDGKLGPLVLPGEYTVILRVEGKEQRQPLHVLPDPRVSDTSGLSEQLAFALTVRDDINTVTASVESLRRLRKQLQEREALLKDNATAKPLLDAGKALVKKLDALEEKWHNPKAEVSYDILARKGGAKLYSQLIWLFEQIKDADGPPTQGQKELHADFTVELKELLRQWRTLATEEVDRYNTLARKLDLPIVVVERQESWK